MDKHGILIDVTAYISAQEYIVSKCKRHFRADPFGLQSYAELVQSIFLYDNVYVPHPLLYSCSKDDFGKEPKLLIELLDRGIVKPLNLSSSVSSRLKNDEENLIPFLQSEGEYQLNNYLTTTQKDEIERIRKGQSLEGVTLSYLRDWAQYQSEIRYSVEHHLKRIPTRDGIEEDTIGDFARSFANKFGKKWRYVGEKQIDYLIATILRGLRYQIRANVAEIPYQSHVMRRDFILACGFLDSGVSKDYTRETIKFIRGIREKIATHSSSQARVELLDLKVPLLGGKLWKDEDLENYRYDNSPDSWINFVVDHIEEYRDETRILRNTIRSIRNKEDLMRVKRDFEIVQEKLVDVFDIKHKVISEVDKDMVKGGLAAVIEGAVSPIMEALIITAKSLIKRKLFSGATPLQQFVYREFLRGWEKQSDLRRSIGNKHIWANEPTSINYINVYLNFSNPYFFNLKNC